jgi:hypothetical protein
VALTAAKLREAIRRVVLGTFLLAAGIALLTFGLDFGVFRLRVARNWHPYGSVVVRRTYAVLQKNGKTQFIFDPPTPENCANALFPHSGMQSCWYLRRHPEQKTNI